MKGHLTVHNYFSSSDIPTGSAFMVFMAFIACATVPKSQRSYVNVVNMSTKQCVEIRLGHFSIFSS